MSDVFFEDLRIDKPNVHFNVGSGSHLKVIAKIMVRAEEHFMSSPTDLIVVVGDVNSTLAIALAGNKMGIPIAHVEAGLRSRNWNMPEETNRILTDRLSELLLTPTKEDSRNLIDEGIEEEKIHLVGNIMIDSLFDSLERIGDGSEVLDRYSVNGAKYGLITLHRPECVDNKENLKAILDAFNAIQKNIKLIWPLHPRTRKTIHEFGLNDSLKELSNVHVVEPVGYHHFLSLMKNSFMVLTDSGGIQEETTALGISCLTLRNETERPITVTEGTNEVVGMDTARIIESVNELLSGKHVKGGIPELWDGKTAGRITRVLQSWWQSKM